MFLCTVLSYFNSFRTKPLVLLPSAAHKIYFLVGLLPKMDRRSFCICNESSPSTNGINPMIMSLLFHRSVRVFISVPRRSWPWAAKHVRIWSSRWLRPSRWAYWSLTFWCVKSLRYGVFLGCCDASDEDLLGDRGAPVLLTCLVASCTFANGN